ncbi:MAG: HAD family hydrolase [Pseudohongiellaceae bacterium]
MTTTSTQMVVFDLYGTLVRFGVQLHPYRAILSWARESGRQPRPDDARRLLTTDGTPEEVFAALDIDPPRELIRQFHIDIAKELASLSLFDDVVPTLERLDQAGIRLAICSNLAKPYGAVIDRLLPQFDLLRCLSYQVGAIKPEPEIYDWLVEVSGVAKESISFVGDNQVADYEGPSDFGFKAFHLVRGAKPAMQRIGSLADLSGVIG